MIDVEEKNRKGRTAVGEKNEDKKGSGEKESQVVTGRKGEGSEAGLIQWPETSLGLAVAAVPTPGISGAQVSLGGTETKSSSRSRVGLWIGRRLWRKGVARLRGRGVGGQECATRVHQNVAVMTRYIRKASR